MSITTPRGGRQLSDTVLAKLSPTLDSQLRPFFSINIWCLNALFSAVILSAFTGHPLQPTSLEPPSCFNKTQALVVWSPYCLSIIQSFLLTLPALKPEQRTNSQQHMLFSQLCFAVAPTPTNCFLRFPTVNNRGFISQSELSTHDLPVQLRGRGVCVLGTQYDDESVLTC